MRSVSLPRRGQPLHPLGDDGFYARGQLLPREIAGSDPAPGGVLDQIGSFLEAAQQFDREERIPARPAGQRLPKRLT